MGDKSKIEWTEATWNPVVGCSKVSPGCAHCYAEELHRTRLDGKGVYPEFRPWTPENADHNVTLVPERLEQPLRWSKPRMIFVNSMSDLFHDLVPDAYIVDVFAVMAKAERHTFQVLTKRPERMADLLSRESFRHQLDDQTMACADYPLPNVWLGTSIENYRFNWRANYLRATPAAVRFISAEPLLGSLLRPPALDLAGVHWLIVGGESGPTRRRVDPEAVRELRQLANASGTAFFFKQWGGRTPKAGGRELDGRTWDEMPAVSGVDAAAVR